VCVCVYNILSTERANLWLFFRLGKELSHPYRALEWFLTSSCLDENEIIMRTRLDGVFPVSTRRWFGSCQAHLRVSIVAHTTYYV